MTTADGMITVLVVDDHPFVRAQIIGVLRDAGIEVVAECADGSEVPGVLANTRPQVVLMDVQMPITSGIAATRDLMISNPTSRVIMLTGSSSAQLIAESAAAGALGFVVKGGPASLLIDAIRTVAAGGTAWPERRPGSTAVPGFRSKRSLSYPRSKQGWMDSSDPALTGGAR